MLGPRRTNRSATAATGVCVPQQSLTTRIGFPPLFATVFHFQKPEYGPLSPIPHGHFLRSENKGRRPQLAASFLWWWALSWTFRRSSEFESNQHDRGARSLAMSAIPVHVQRRFEQRWASRFNLSKTTKKAEIKPITNGAAPAANVIGQPAGVNRRTSVELTKN